MDERPQSEPADEQALPEQGQGPTPDLAMLLTGDLPCIGCGYDIRGLSVLAQCPECGLAVRATILHRVDPHSHVLQPMPAPRLTAAGLLLWSGGGALAGLLLWAPRVVDLVEEVTTGRVWFDVRLATSLALGSLAVSGLGLLGMMRPTADTPRRRVLAGLLALACYLPLLISVAQIARLDLGHTPYIADDPSSERLGWRLAAGASVAAMLLLIRPSARELVNRSLVLRTKRVDRQTIYATVGAVAVTMAGDLLRLGAAAGAGPMDWLNWTGSMVVLVGSVLVTLGLAGALVDSWRIARAILAPSMTPEQALRRSAEPSRD
jgi:hypothetical protein